MASTPATTARKGIHLKPNAYNNHHNYKSIMSFNRVPFGKMREYSPSWITLSSNCWANCLLSALSNTWLLAWLPGISVAGLVPFKERPVGVYTCVTWNVIQACHICG